MRAKSLKRCFSFIIVIALMFTMLPPMEFGTPVFADEAGGASDPGSSSETTLEGKGTEQEPYKIKDKEDLAAMRDHVNKNEVYSDDQPYAKAYYVLESDIDLQCADGNSWYPIGRYGSGMNDGVAFEGVFDGNGYTISGLYIDGDDKSLDSYDGFSHSTSRVYNFGLFGENKGTIKNLTVKDAKLINLGMYNGIIAGTNGGIVENCSTSGNITGSFSNGGIVGLCSATVKNCMSTATGYSAAFGGICGGWSASTATITNNYYLETSVANGTDADGKAQAMSEADFKSGKVAWLLQGGQTDKSALVWEQDVDSENYPVIHRNGDDTENRVYKVSYMLSDKVVGEDYRNTGDMTTAPEIDADVEGFTAGDKWYKEADLNTQWNFDSDTVTEDTTLYSEKKAIEYTITLALNGGTISDDGWDNNQKTFTVLSDNITLPTPTKDGYTFIGWTSNIEDIVGSAEPTVTVKKGSTGDRTYTAVYKDATAPDVTIKIGNQEWHALNTNPTFDLFYNKTQTVTISATDNEDGVLNIQYYIGYGRVSLTESQLNNVSWIDYNAPFTISPEKNIIVYAKVTDDDGNVSYISTTGIVLEVTRPVISGVTDGSTSCEAAVFKVTDEYLLSVTIDGEPAEAVNGKYTVSSIGAHTVVATDKAGNQRTVNFTISDHKPGMTTYETVTQAGCETDGTRIKKVYCQNCNTLYSTTTETVKALGHNWSDWQTLDTPTCNDSGTQQRECRRCGKTETKGLDAAGHDWESDYTIDKAATCTEPGSKSIHCKKCPATQKSEVIPVIPHTPGAPTQDRFIDADCTQSGSYDLVTNCTVCGTELTRQPVTIPAKGHSFTEWKEIESPNCDDEGHLQRSCKICGIIETQDVAASGHKWNTNYTIDQAATCTTAGSKSIHCSVCSATKDSKVIPATGHKESAIVTENVTAASCTAPGSRDEVIYCTVCNEELSRKTVATAALGHDFTDWETVDMPNCNDKGTQQRVCTVCGYTESRGLDAKGHDWETSYTVDTEPTCTTNGSKSIHCKNCDATKNSTVIKATGHKFGAWTTIDMPDCDDTGTQQRVCTVCGYTETRGLDAKGHDWETDYTVDTEPTCTTNGSKSIHCKNCDATKNSTVIKATGHKFGEWTTISMPDCDDKGTQQRVCTVCGYTETRGLDAKGHDWDSDYTVDTQPTCTTDGSKSIHCKNCDATMNSTVIPATGHKWSEWINSSFDIVKGTRTQTRTCPVCKVTETRTISGAVNRIAGSNRYGTSSEISKAMNADKADTVVLAYGLSSADALAGVPLATALNAPILLTTTDKIPDETLAEIKRLGAKKVVILGGTGVISEKVEAALVANGIAKNDIERLAGKTRFETAAKIAEKLQNVTKAAPTEAFFVYYNSYADALSASTVAAIKGAPIFYVTTNGKLDDATKAQLDKIKPSITKAYVIGGTGVISESMKNSIALALEKPVIRVSGANRYATCVEVNNTFEDVLTGTAICVAKGLDFPDALAGGVFAAKNNAPLFLADSKLQEVQSTYLKSKKADSIYIFGGTGAVPDSLVEAIANASV